MDPNIPNQLSDNELTKLIVDALKEYRNGTPFTINIISKWCQNWADRNGYTQVHIHYRVFEIIWKMILDNLIIPHETNHSQSNIENWGLRVTGRGEQFLAQAEFYFDPDGYRALLKSSANPLDPIIEQYATEALKCFKQKLTFASAVMIGAAAEKAILLLYEAIIESAEDINIITRLQKAMHGTAKMPMIYNTIEKATDKFAKQIEKFDPKATECATHHMKSFADMIRRQRNNAVHPVTADVDETLVLISINTFPIALEITHRLRSFFDANKGKLAIPA